MTLESPSGIAFGDILFYFKIFERNTEGSYGRIFPVKRKSIENLKASPARPILRQHIP